VPHGSEYARFVEQAAQAQDKKVTLKGTILCATLLEQFVELRVCLLVFDLPGRDPLLAVFLGDRADHG
jgi:hypothetical protein